RQGHVRQALLLEQAVARLAGGGRQDRGDAAAAHREVGRHAGYRQAALNGVQAGSTCLFRIHACLPTCLTRWKPWSSNSSAVPVKRKRPCASRPETVSAMVSTRPPPRWAICSSAPPTARRRIPWPRWRLSTKQQAVRQSGVGGSSI